MIYIIMGVSGSGKTAVGKALSQSLKIPFVDADDHHSKENIEKMKKSIPLNDKDRLPWLKKLSGIIKNEQKNEGIILACSVLKNKYRKILLDNIPKQKLLLVYLKGNLEIITKRMKSRNHFFPVNLLKSQFNDLEEPDDALVINIETSIEKIIKKIRDLSLLH